MFGFVRKDVWFFIVSTMQKQPMKTFVMHWKPLVQRKPHVIHQLEKHNIHDYEFIELEMSDVDPRWNEKFHPRLSDRKKSLSIKHYHVYKEISEKYDQALVFEDDIVLDTHFSSKFNTMMSQLPKEYDMLFIGNGCNLHIDANQIKPGQFVYEKNVEHVTGKTHGASRCTDSYVISKKGAQTLCDYAERSQELIDLPIDWWLNDAARDNQLKMYWAEPTIVTQGSQNGLFARSID